MLVPTHGFVVETRRFRGRSFSACYPVGAVDEAVAGQVAIRSGSTNRIAYT
jgi:hypothetical protein